MPPLDDPRPRRDRPPPPMRPDPSGPPSSRQGLPAGAADDGGEAFERRLHALTARLRASSTAPGDPGAVEEALGELLSATEQLRVGRRELYRRSDELADSWERLDAAHRRYQDLFEFAPTAFVLTDLRGVIGEVNGGAAALLNAERRFLVGKPLASFVPMGHRRRLRDVITVMRTEQGPAEWETEVAPRRRPPTPIEIAVGTERDERGAVVGLRWLLRDATRRRTAEQAAQRYAAELSDALSAEPRGERGLRASLSDLGRLLVADDPLLGYGRRVSVLATSAVPAATRAGVALINQEEVVTFAPGDPVVARLDAAQVGTGEGPALRVLVDDRVGRSGQLAAQYPRFGPAAEREGLRSALALPLRASGAQIGALVLYAEERDAFDEEARRLGERFAEQAAYALANAVVYAESERLAAQLREALSSRAEIEQAKGVVMAQTGVGADEAFALLRAQSQREHRKLREVATLVVASAAGALPAGSAPAGSAPAGSAPAGSDRSDAGRPAPAPARGGAPTHRRPGDARPGAGESVGAVE